LLAFGAELEKKRSEFEKLTDCIDELLDPAYTLNERLCSMMALKEPTHSHPGYRRALRLLNNTFSKASLRQRPAVLKAAIWLINITEHQATTAAKASDDYPVEGTGSNQRLRCEDNFKRLVQKINPQGKAAE
jgi:hypothetical protein